MFESAELGHKVDKETWQRRLPVLREALLDAQFDLLDSGHTAVVVLIGGVEASLLAQRATMLSKARKARLTESGLRRMVAFWRSA